MIQDACNRPTYHSFSYKMLVYLKSLENIFVTLITLSSIITLSRIFLIKFTLFNFKKVFGGPPIMDAPWFVS